MKEAKNELLEFLGGVAMLAVGLYWFSLNVRVSSTFFSGGLMLGSITIHNGLVIVPFIIAVILVFIKPESFGRKLFLGISVLLIIASIIYSTNFHLVSMSLFEWAGILNSYLVGWRSCARFCSSRLIKIKIRRKAIKLRYKY